MPQSHQPERQQTAEFGAALGGRHLAWRQGIGAGSIGVHRVSHAANATRVSAENNHQQQLEGFMRSVAEPIET